MERSVGATINSYFSALEGPLVLFELLRITQVLIERAPCK